MVVAVAAVVAIVTMLLIAASFPADRTYSSLARGCPDQLEARQFQLERVRVEDVVCDPV